MSSGPTEGAFHRNSPLYPLLMNYLAALIGYRSLAILSLAKAIRQLSPQECDGIVQQSLDSDDIDIVRLLEIIRTINVSDLYPQFLLPSSAYGMHTVLDLSDVESEYSSINSLTTDADLLSVIESSCMANLLVSAYEKIREYSNHSELWEFFRHCSDAAARGGIFSFGPGEPIRPARWVRLTITRAWEGAALFLTPSTPGGLLALGDPLRLLLDIEEATPQLIQPG